MFSIARKLTWNRTARAPANERITVNTVICALLGIVFLLFLLFFLFLLGVITVSSSPCCKFWRSTLKFFLCDCGLLVHFVHFRLLALPVWIVFQKALNDTRYNVIFPQPVHLYFSIVKMNEHLRRNRKIEGNSNTAERQVGQVFACFLQSEKQHAQKQCKQGINETGLYMMSVQILHVIFSIAHNYPPQIAATRSDPPQI